MAGWARGRASGAWVASVMTGVDWKVWAIAGAAAAVIKTARQAAVRRVRGIRSSTSAGGAAPSGAMGDASSVALCLLPMKWGGGAARLRAVTEGFSDAPRALKSPSTTLRAVPL